MTAAVDKGAEGVLVRPAQPRRMAALGRASREDEARDAGDDSSPKPPRWIEATADGNCGGAASWRRRGGAPNQQLADL